MLEIEEKEDSPEKLAAVAGKPTKNFLFASELNSLVASAKKSERKFIEFRDKFVFKGQNNTQLNSLEIGDFVIGFVEDRFIIGGYISDKGGFDKEGIDVAGENLLSNYLILLSKNNYVDEQ